jgi:hypothetical protein
MSVTYYHAYDGTIVVDTPDTELALDGRMWSRRQWHLEQGTFNQLRTENGDVKFRRVAVPEKI